MSPEEALILASVLPPLMILKNDIHSYAYLRPSAILMPRDVLPGNPEAVLIGLPVIYSADISEPSLVYTPRRLTT